jgi:hypothetical protein
VDYVSIPTSTVSAEVPDFYDAMAEEPGDFAIAGLPGKRHHTERYMFYQTHHEHPILGGHVSRLPPEALNFASSVPLIADMYTEVAIDTSLPDISRQLGLLAEADFKYVIIHKALATEQQLDAWQSYLAIEPRYEDGDVAVYPTEPVVGVDCSIEHDFGGGMTLVETRLSTREISPDGLLEMDVIWGATAAPGDDLQLELALVDGEGTAGQRERFMISSSWPTGQWPANAVVRDTYTFQVEPWPRAGEQALVARLIRAGEGQTVGREVDIETLVMRRPERTFDIPPMDRTLNARFGDALRLLGYDLRVGADAVDVTLHWRALRRMEQSYKFFVHLYDAESRELVAQRDTVPYDWQYPTVWWEVDEVVSDELSIPLDDVQANTYDLAVGVYDPETKDRLVFRGDGASVTPETLVLQEVTVP